MKPTENTKQRRNRRKPHWSSQLFRDSSTFSNSSPIPENAITVFSSSALAERANRSDTSARTEHRRSDSNYLPEASGDHRFMKPVSKPPPPNEISAAILLRAFFCGAALAGRIVADNFDNSGHLGHDPDYLTDWALDVGNLMFEKFADEQES
jgi:hypothetical protein